MGQRVFVGASAAATLPAALSAAVLVSAPFAGTSVSPLAGARAAGSTTVAAAESSPAPSPGPGATDWAMLAMGEAIVLAGAAATVTLRRRARVDAH